jgi:hypothetical protein
MWQAPNQRLRAIASQKRRERERNRRPLHLKRVQAQIKILSQSVEPEITEARVILNDFSPKGLGLFSSKPVLVGQEVAITLDKPRRIYVRGRVVWCQEYDAGSHVLSATSFSYRMGVQFVFETQEELQSIQEFCDELNRGYLHSTQVA